MPRQKSNAPTSRVFFVWKLFPQLTHVKSLSDVWRFMWFFKFAFSLHENEQRGQENGRSWKDGKERLLNAWSHRCHSLHTSSKREVKRTSVWTFWWRSSCSFLGKIASHERHGNEWASSARDPDYSLMKTTIECAGNDPSANSRAHELPCYTSFSFVPWGISPAFSKCVSLSSCLLNRCSSANDNLHTLQTKGLNRNFNLAWSKSPKQCYRHRYYVQMSLSTNLSSEWNWARCTLSL